MKKYLVSATLPLIYFFNPFVATAFAINTTPTPISLCPQGQFGALCNLTGNNIGPFLAGAFNLIVLVAVIVATAYLIYGGIKWTISRGDKAEVENARNHIVAAIVGLIIVFLTFFIISVILRVFGADSSIGGFIIPQIVPSITP